jgi:hypothetical protein
LDYRHHVLTELRLHTHDALAAAACYGGFKHDTDVRRGGEAEVARYMSGKVLITGGAGFIGPHLARMIGRTYGFDVVALRLFHVFGPRQALSNPYPGVLAIFASRLLNGLGELTDWRAGQVALDRMDQATREIERRGLTL